MPNEAQALTEMPQNAIEKKSRSYLGQSDCLSDLSYRSLTGLVRSCTDNLPYCRYYSGGRFIRSLTCVELHNVAARLALELVEHGALPGARIMVGMRNSDLTLAAYCAVFLAGCVLVPVDPDADDATLMHVARDSKASFLLHGSANKARFIGIGPALLAVTDRILQGTACLVNRFVKEPEPGDTAVIIYTSGTTGAPKGVMLSHMNLLANAEATVRLHGMRPGHVHMCVLPLFHVNAMCFSFLSSLYSRSSLILNRSFYLPEFWRIAAAESVHVISLAPPLAELLVNDRRDLGRNVIPTSVRYLVSAAAALRRETASAFHRRFGVRINQHYGMSEAVNFSLATPAELTDEEYAEIFLRRTPPTAGCPVWGNEIAIMGSDGGLLPDNCEGEVVLRGYNVMQGYLNRPEATAKTLAGGWLHTGDIGFAETFANRRFFFLAGRRKEILNRGGEKVALPMLDAKVRSLPGLEKTVTVGFPNRAVGEEIGLFVVPEEQTTDPAVILAMCRERLGRKFAPKAVVFGKRLPVTSTGKIRRSHLVEYFKKYSETIF